jgi:MFS family permease
MDGDPDDVREEASSGRFVLPSLIFSTFATYPMSIVSNLLLIEIGLAFGQPVGAISQMRTLSYGLAFLSALAMGALSVRFKPKTLLLAGLLCLSVSALGSGAALNLPMLFTFFAISGLGTSMVEPMISTLIAEHFPEEERPKVIGWIGAGGGLSYMIGGSAIGYIAILGGWRLAFLGYAMLLPLLGFIIISRGIPSTGHESRPGGVDLTEGFRAISSSRSAAACLLGNLLASAAGQGIYVYSFSFLKEAHLASPGWTAAIFTAASVCFFLGSLVCGWFVEKLGRKAVTVSALLLASLLTGLYDNLPGLWVVVALILMGHFGRQQSESGAGPRVPGDDDVTALGRGLHGIRPGDRGRGADPPPIRLGDAEHRFRGHMFRFGCVLLPRQGSHDRPTISVASPLAATVSCKGKCWNICVGGYPLS